MKNSPRMHRPTAVIAAVMMSLSQLLNAAASFSVFNTNPSVNLLITTLGNILITVLLVAMLFRGKKDLVAGVVFLITLIAPMMSVGYDLLSVLAGYDKILYVAISVSSGLLLIGFRGLSAGECLSQGKISACGGRVFLWILPILCFVCESATQMILCIYSGVNMDGMIFSILVYEIPQWVGPVLMGISLSVQKT